MTMTGNFAKGNRGSIRLRDYDYSRPGAYFVTICAHDRGHRFGQISGGEMHLNLAGETVWEVWRMLPDRYPGVQNDAFIVMPNHVHGIIMINDHVGAIHVGANDVRAIDKRAIRESPLQSASVPNNRRKMLLPTVVGFFKMNTAKKINQAGGNPGIPVWQRDYYEHIVRDERALSAIRRYIQFNPTFWPYDHDNPEVLKPDRESFAQTMRRNGFTIEETEIISRCSMIDSDCDSGKGNFRKGD
jgi:putative transposase